ncbi:hypothetical protein RJ640_001518 [Escallonia rubra]|uniref:proteasome endopeptidase complex n=1 Tax=Escallonia rubra TaxID=112253 RepID=A0AA88QSZ7_9ASTE|nr:hypothetical protein RJ640_001518 [Escallonia rubra]
MKSSMWASVLTSNISLFALCLVEGIRSGSTYLYGFFDQEWKEGMTKDEAEKLVVKAVSLAIARDGASGGVVRTVIINSDGVTRNFYPGDSLPLWHEELEPQNSLLDILSSSSSEPMEVDLLFEGKELSEEIYHPVEAGNSIKRLKETSTHAIHSQLLH